MLFASDLDRTLIYSKRFITEEIPYQGQVTMVEEGAYTSYMTALAAEMIEFISAKVLFVPCTTRTIEQYKRIQFFQNKVVPKYAVVSNGGNLLIDGVLDQNYRSEINEKLNDSCLSQTTVISEFRKIARNNWIESIRQADQLFYYCLIDRSQTPWDELNCFSRWAAGQNWHISVQGRKLYLVPMVVDKYNGVKSVLGKTGKEAVFAVGDSLLDLQLLQSSVYSYCPGYGELYDLYGQQYNKTTLRFTNSAGIIAAEDILAEVIRWIDVK